MHTETTKRCKRCKKVKPLEGGFYKINSRRKPGVIEYGPKCAGCEDEVRAEARDQKDSVSESSIRLMRMQWVA